MYCIVHAVFILVAIPPTNAEAADLADRFHFRIPDYKKQYDNEYEYERERIISPNSLCKKKISAVFYAGRANLESRPKRADETLYSRPESTEYESNKTYPNLNDQWTDTKFCKPGTWAEGVIAKQDDERRDYKGVTKVTLFCKNHPSRSEFSHTISLGVEKGRLTPWANCTNARVLTGFRTVYGNSSLGLVHLRPICKWANYSGDRPNRPDYKDEMTIAAFNSKTFSSRLTKWDFVLPNIECEEDSAVCGFATKIGPASRTDEAGITGIKIRCCPIPQPCEYGPVQCDYGDDPKTCKQHISCTV